MKLNNITKTYQNKNNRVTALNGISFSLEEKGLYLIYGASGSGKTTLLNIIAGKDKEFGGEYENEGKIAYLRQDFLLVGDLSVRDNLLFAKDDEKTIDEYLKAFGIFDLKYKKVKKLSNGQKKRVQLISQILLSPDILLCDEPTSALDHDNSEKIMSFLKDLSKEMIVIVVSHDIALSLKYADRIITLENGRIIKDETLAHHSPNINKSSSLKRHLKDYIVNAFKTIYARPLYYLGYLIIVLAAVFSFYMITSLYSSISKEDDYAAVFERGENFIISRPKTLFDCEYGDCPAGMNYFSILAANKGYTDKYTDYDLVYLEDIERAVKDNPDIIAYEAFYDYRYVGHPKQYVTGNNTPLEYEKIADGVIRTISDFNDFYDLDDSGSTKVFLYDSLFIVDLDKILNMIQSDTIDNMDTSSYYAQNPRYLIDMLEDQAHLYLLVNDYQSLPLIYGKYPQDGEAMIDRNTADFLLELYGLESYEELLGQKVTLGVYSYGYSDLKNRGFDQFMINGFNEDETDEEWQDVLARMKDPNTDYNDYLPFEAFPYTISGITSVYTDDELMVFVDDKAEDLAIYDYYFDDVKRSFFDYVNFIVEPNVNYQEVKENITDSFTFINDSFVLKDTFDLENNTAYDDPLSLVPFLSAVSLGALIILVIYRLFDKKKNHELKEYLDLMEYKVMLFMVFRALILTILSAFIALACFYFICEYINGYAAIYNYAKIISYSPLYIIITCLLSDIIIFVIEMAGTKL